MKIRYKIFNLIIAALLIVILIGNVFAWFSAKDAELKIDGASAGAYFKAGSGTEKDPFTLGNFRHYYNLAWLQNTGKLKGGEYYFALDPDNGTTLNMVDEDGKSVVVPPIGTAENPFNGKFDGKGKTISNLIVSTNKSVLYGEHSQDSFVFSNAVGMFGMTGDGAEIKDFILINPTVEVVETNSKFSEVSSSDPKVFGLAVGHVADNVKVSTIGIVEGNLSVQRTNYVTANNIIGDIAGGINSSDFPTGNTQGSGVQGNISYFLPNEFNNKKITKIETGDWVVSANGYSEDNVKRWSTDPNTTVSNDSGLGLNGFSLISGGSIEFRSSGAQSMEQFLYAEYTPNKKLDLNTYSNSDYTILVDKDYTYPVTYNGSKYIVGAATKTHNDANTYWDNIIIDKSGKPFTDNVIQGTFRLSGSGTKIGNATLNIKSEIVQNGSFTNIASSINSNSEFANLYQNAFYVNITENKASILVNCISSSSYDYLNASNDKATLQVLKLLDKAELDYRIKFKAAKSLNLGSYANKTYSGLTETEKSNLNTYSELTNVNSRDFFLINDYELLENIDPNAEKTIYSLPLRSNNTSGNGLGTLFDSPHNKRTSVTYKIDLSAEYEETGPGLYAIYTTTSNTDILYLSATGIAYGDDGGGGETPQEKLVTNVDFVDNEVTIVDSIFNNYTATGVRIYYESVSALYIYFNRTKDSFAVKYNNSKPTTTDDTKVTLSATTNTFEISETFDPATDLNRPF